MLARDFKLKGTPDEIKLRHAEYVRRYPDMADTPDAVLKHWDQMIPPPPKLGLGGRALG